MVIVEGAEYASALCAYLKTCCGFTIVEYKPEQEHFTDLLDRIIFDAYLPRLAVCRAHLTAISRSAITPAYFKSFEEAVAFTSAKLVLAVSETDSINSGLLADSYAQSWLEKRTYKDGDQISELLEWLGLRDEGRRAKISSDNVRANGAELGTGLATGGRSDANNREIGGQSRDDGAVAPRRRQKPRSKTRGG